MPRRRRSIRECAVFLDILRDADDWAGFEDFFAGSGEAAGEEVEWDGLGFISIIFRALLGGGGSVTFSLLDLLFLFFVEEARIIGETGVYSGYLSSSLPEIINVDEGPDRVLSKTEGGSSSSISICSSSWPPSLAAGWIEDCGVGSWVGRGISDGLSLE